MSPVIAYLASVFPYPFASRRYSYRHSVSLIDYTKLSQGAIIGIAILYDVKGYKSKAEFVKDKNKHYANITKIWFQVWIYGKKCYRFRAPMPYPGKLRFFEVQYPINA